MSVVTQKDLQRYGSTRKSVSVGGLNGSGWRGDIMNFETQLSEMVLLNQINKEELANVLVELIKDNRELRRAILEVVWKCPNIVTRI